MKALVVGYGSIGARHARVLGQLGCDTAVLSAREIDFPRVYHRLDEALVTHEPEYVVIANQTSQHHETLSRLAAAGFGGRVLVEKPIFDTSRLLPPAAFRHIAVAYNLRFHPLIRRLRELVAGQKLISLHAYVGQYLPTWRPVADYRSSYSASRSQGGGVLRDLSHELDYLAWLCGDWKAMASLGGHFSDLEIDSEDLFVLLMQTSLCHAVTVQMSYLDRQATRRIIANTNTNTFEVDLVAGVISVDGQREIVPVDRDFSYAEMHRTYLHGDETELCSVADALRTLDLIECAEQANQTRTWVSS